MSEVYLKGTEVLGRLKSACTALGQKSTEAIELVLSDITATREWLMDRQTFWLREKAVAEEHLATAEANLATCESSGYWDDDGNYCEPDCSSEESDLAAARARLEESCRQLAKTEGWCLQCEMAISSFARAKDSFDVTVLQRLPSAGNYLETKHQQYGAAIASSIGVATLVAGAIAENSPQAASKKGTGGGWKRPPSIDNPEVNTGATSVRNDSIRAEGTAERSPSTGEGGTDFDYKKATSAAAALAATKELFERAGIRRGEPVTVQNVQALRALLTQTDFRAANSIVGKIATQSPTLTEELLLSVVRDFSSMIPADVAAKLPQFDLEVKHLGRNVLGAYDGHTIFLSPNLDQFAVRGTMFHEMGHWLHNNGPEWYREAICEHFRERTAGEEIATLDGYESQGKADGWNDPYSGRIYDEEVGDPQGREIPSTHFEILAYSDEQCAAELSLSACQETMEVTLSGVAGEDMSEGDKADE